MTDVLKPCYQDRCHVCLITTDNKLHLDPVSLLGGDMAAKRALLFIERCASGSIFALHFLIFKNFRVILSI